MPPEQADGTLTGGLMPLLTISSCRSSLMSHSLTKETFLIHSLRSDVIGLTKETELLVWCHI